MLFFSGQLHGQFAAHCAVIQDHRDRRYIDALSALSQVLADLNLPVAVAVDVDLLLIHVETPTRELREGMLLQADERLMNCCELISSGKLNKALINKFLALCADFNWWTQTHCVHGCASRRQR